MAKIKKKEAEFLEQVLDGLSAPFHLSYRFIALGEMITNANDTLFKQQLGLGMKEIRILRLAYQFPGQPVSVIARWTFSEKAMMSKLVSRLCSLDYLERRIDDTDARSTQLFVTPSGAALVKKADTLSNELFRKQFPALSREASASLMKTLDDVLRDFVSAQMTSGTARGKTVAAKRPRKTG
jgi:DNA-binding MarR family transcriptional regulator